MTQGSEAWQAILGAMAASGVFSGLVTWLATRQKTRSETGKLITESDVMRAELEIKMNKGALELIESYRKEVKALTDKIDKLVVTIKKKDEIIVQLQKDLKQIKSHVKGCENELGIKKTV